MQDTATKARANLSTQELISAALERGEGRLSANNSLVVETGKRTGRSPKDRYIVCDTETENTVDWGAVNQPISTEKFDRLWAKAIAHLQSRDIFTSQLQVGADESYALPVNVMTELAWHNLFCRHMFITPAPSARFPQPGWTLANAASLTLDPAADGVNGDGAVIINFSQRKVLLCGMLYAGEMKKAMFTALNYLCPKQSILPMHCAANSGEKGDVALFFGLSGTGKTTLSADPSRYLIGDDEHGWSDNGIANFEGGCYAKCIDLSQEREPVIWNAIRDGAIMENVIVNHEGQPDYSDSRLTLNTRAAYPRHHIEKKVDLNRAGMPQTVIFLTCDLYGVLPPVSMLSKEQAAYYFLSGYTALVGSTEVGAPTGVQPTFSACFGAPFFPRAATLYADLLIDKLSQTGAQAYLVNTGWFGGGYGKGGERFPIPVTRRIVAAAISGELIDAETTKYTGFNLTIPTCLAGVDSNILNPTKNWQDTSELKQQSNKLIALFNKNFKQFEVADVIASAGPKIQD